MNPSVLEALNEQIRKELESSYAYLAMAAHLSSWSYEGFASWMKIQVQEELAHALRIYDYVLSRGERPELRSIAEPERGFESPLSVFEAVLAHEKSVTRSIHALYLLAQQEGDVATMRAMDWFVTEQVEEEEAAQTAVDLIAKAGDDGPALLMLDRDFGARTPGGASEGAG